jgi:carbonic anhydrase-like protein
MRRKLAYLAVIFLATFAVAQQPAAPAPPAAHNGHAAQPAQSPDKIWSDLMDGNKRFVAGKLKPRAVVSVRESLTQSQHPKVMVLSCSASRVPPELVFDQTLGDLFVVRAAGNIAGPLGACQHGVCLRSPRQHGVGGAGPHQVRSGHRRLLGREDADGEPASFSANH